MKKKVCLDLIQNEKIIAIIRAENIETAVNSAKACIAGGCKIVKLTMTTPDALEGIKILKKENYVVGIGTVLDKESAEKAIKCNTDFIVCPHIDKKIISTAVEADVAIVPGALTPTEIFKAHKLGADLVKIFPINALGGVSFLKSILGPFPFLKLLVTGGVNEDTFTEYLKNGAVCAGIGDSLFKKEWLKNKKFDMITEAAKKIIVKRNTLIL